MTNEISSKTKVYGIIGNPVRHSLSPYIHNYFFNCYSIDGVYLPFEVEQSSLKAAIDGIRVLKIEGLNVTAPFKERVIEYIDGVYESAEFVGSVNTIKNVDGKLLGYNTDYTGIVKALEYENIEAKGRKVLMIGAGAIAQTICLALGALGAEEIVILNRTEEKAKNIVEKLKKRRILYKNGELNNVNISNEINNADIIINATSTDILGNGAYNINFKKIKKPAVFFDVIYNPKHTNILRLAHNNGFKTINGLSLLVFQAIEAFEIWTGIRPYQEDINKLFSMLNKLI